MIREVSKVDVLSFGDCDTPMGEMTKRGNDWIHTLPSYHIKCSGCLIKKTCRATYYRFPDYVLFVQLKKPKIDVAPILQNIVSFLKNRNREDMTFEIGGNNLHAHTQIVGASSPVLAAMFQNDFKEGLTKTVKIEDTTVEVFQQFLHYLYTNQVPEMKKEGIAAGLFELADKYAVDSLKEESAICLAKQLDVENAVKTLIAAYLHSSESLQQKTLSFMSKNGLAICSRPDWLQLMENYPKLCFQATQRIVTTLTRK